MVRQASFLCSLLSLLLHAVALEANQALPLFDVHSHYKSEDSGFFSSADIVAILDRQNIEKMVIVGEPADRAQALYQFAPDRFIPFLGLYSNYREKADWMSDSALPARLRLQLDSGYYAGIGEIHLFAPEKNNTVFKEVLGLASEYGLPVLLHGDPEVVEQAFEWFPDLAVIWAHLGTRPEPSIIRGMLLKFHGRLYVDTSVRDERFVLDGKLRQQWRSLFVDHADSVLMAIDTYSLQRWQRIDDVVGNIRHWLAQLPGDVARRIAYENARELFFLNRK